MEGSVSSQSPDEWLPSELGPYDEATYKAGIPYITGVLSSYVGNFSIGDEKEYVSSNRKRRNIGSLVYKNVPLKANTKYLVFQRAYVSQVLFPIFSTNMALNYRTHLVFKKILYIINSRILAKTFFF